MNVAYARDRIYKSIGNRRQLFIDDDVIAAVHNISRRQHTPVKHPENPLIERDKPWEVVPYFRTSTFNVIKDPVDGMFKCWYEDYYDYFGWDHSKEMQSNRVYFARSRDRTLTGKSRRLGNSPSTVTTPTPCSAIRPTQWHPAIRSFSTQRRRTRRVDSSRCTTTARGT